ncbi:MAG TPA: CBS domain-containing protein, partial [Phaeodactylibacter sp.]|nr:CBS domain-containing protein [Phaeodactylibacter sp.]
LFQNPKIETYNEILFQTLLVKDIMTKTVVSFRPTDSIQLAYMVFKENKFRAMPVLSGEKLVGIVTPLDILDYFFKMS